MPREPPDLFGLDSEFRPDPPTRSDSEPGEGIAGGEELLGDQAPETSRPAHRKTGKETRRRWPSGETVRRVLVAIPWIIFAISITVAGGLVFAVAMISLGLIGLREFTVIAQQYRPIEIAAYIALPAMILAGHFGTAFNVLLIASAAFPLLFLFGAQRQSSDAITVSIGVTLLGVFWIGIPLVHAVLLRDLPLHGAALLVDVLVGTFVTDTAAYATGRMFGTHKIAPRLSPNKTIEGLIGGFVIGTMGFWFAGLYQDWLSGIDALIMGAAVAAMAPVGDLFESMIKRDLGVKDAGSIFGPHGGLLDRLDAIFFTIVIGYYLSVAFVY